jgi:hypothetical protein
LRLLQRFYYLSVHFSTRILLFFLSVINVTIFGETKPIKVYFIFCQILVS